MKLLIHLSILAISLVGLTSQAQSFEKYKEMNGVVSVNINKNMFKLMSQLDLETEDKEAQEMINMINQLKSIQIFTTSNPETGAALSKDAMAFMKNQKLEELMSVNDEDGKKVRFYFQPGATDNMVKQLFMHINDAEETIVIMIEGNVNLAQIGKIAKEFNLPGSDSFNELDKNN
jgi:hypothetical protein